MPSLKQLKQLQDLFGEIGGEREILENAGLRPDVYELPANEPRPRPQAPEEVPTPSQPVTEQPAAEERPAAEVEQPAAKERPVAEVEQPVAEEQPAAEVEQPAAEVEQPAAEVEQPADDAETDAGDDSIFERLLAGMGDLIGSVPTEDELPQPPDIGDTPSDVSAAGIDSFDLELEPPADEATDTAADIDSFSLDLSPPTEPEPVRDTTELDDELDLTEMLKGFGEDDGTGDGLSEDEDGKVPDEVSDLDSIPSISEISDEEKASLFPEQPDGKVEQPDDKTKQTEDKTEQAENGQPETLPDIEDFLSSIDAPAKVSEAAVAPDAGEKPAKPVEAINITEKQLQQLLDTIASYPLNLRIVCEKLIAEEFVEPSLLSQFIKLLIRGGNAHEAATLAGKILKRNIPLPKGYKTGEELEAERSSFVYIFLHKFFPVIRLSLLIAALAASVTYLSYQFIYKPVHAHMIYKNGYERIEEGEYTMGNRRFEDAFAIYPVKKWFYRYAELFRDERQYLYAEEKYDELLLNYPHDKKGTLDYAAMEAEYLRNYEKADRLIRTNILDYRLDDKEGLLALGDVNLAWGDYDPSRYEEARLAYAKYMTAYAQTDPLLERMMLYFIRTDKLGEVIPLQNYFMGQSKSKIAASSLAELGGYLLDKRFEVVKGVPNEHIEEIQNVKDVLLRAVGQDFSLPETHYHLARYYSNYGNTQEERQALETAVAAFDTARPESPERTRYRVDAQRRLARLLINGNEFISAEEALVKGLNIMEDAVERRIVQRSREFGELYAYLGDLAYFTKSGDMREAEVFYLSAEKNGWSPPEMQYRLGSAYYYLGDYTSAMNRFFNVSMEIPYNRRLLNALGNVSYMRSDYDAAAGYFKRLIAMLESDRNRFPVLLPHDRPEHREVVERMMVARNNLGVTYNALANVKGNPAYRAAALGELSEAVRYWDTLERNPQTLIRTGITDPAVPGTSLPYLNIQNTLYPTQGGNGLLFMQIDKDLTDNSWWEGLMHMKGLPN